MKALRAWILSRLLTAAQLNRLAEKPDQTLARVLSAGELQLVQALRAPDRWQPIERITPQEAEAWGAALKSPLLGKLDVAMSNMCQQKAQEACHAESKDIVRLAGYAAGFRGAWAFVKSLSTLTGAPAGESEPGADTAGSELDHLNP